jgi:hypothetical protein
VGDKAMADLLAVLLTENFILVNNNAVEPADSLELAGHYLPGFISQ